MTNAGVKLGLYDMSLEPLKNYKVTFAVFFHPFHNTFNLCIVKEHPKLIISEDEDR